MNNRYVVKFSKDGYIKYISHLDLLRVFKRSFKVAGIDLKYSQGFNPHPKMGFAQPLSLGYSSDCELMEFETIKPERPDELKLKIEQEMPIGIQILDVFAFDSDVKSLAGETVSCRYLIYIPFNGTEDELTKLTEGYLGQSSIQAMKRMKKTKDYRLVEIRHMIQSIRPYKEGEWGVLDTLLDSGSQSNLSPELVIASFIDYAELDIRRYEVEVKRTEINFTNRIQF